MAVKSLNIKNVTVTLEAKRVKRVPGGKRLNKKSLFLRSPATTGSRWKEPYEPNPLISRSTILFLGFGLYGLTFIWAPLLLVMAFLASMLVPYCFRENDNAETRRKLFAEFSRELDLPSDFRRTPDDILLEESFWVNARYVLKSCEKDLVSSLQMFFAHNIMMFVHFWTFSIIANPSVACVYIRIL